MHSRVLCCAITVCSLAATVRAADPGLFALTTNRQYEDNFDVRDHPRLGDLGYRELVRQGILLTAREEFGLATRDETLLETVDRQSPTTFDVVVTAKAYHGVNFQLRHGEEQLLDLYLRDMLENANAYRAIAAQVDRQTRAEYVQALERAGLQTRPHRWLESAPLPDGAESLLQQMNAISQYRAVRTIHQAINATGESPERLDGLVRGYSNLAQLTIRGPDCRGYAFRCRAWLYANRLLHKAGDTPDARWRWAYMAVMAGLPAQAEDVVAGARRDAPDEAPPWGSLLEDYIRYDYERLSQHAFVNTDAAYSELATVLWVRAVQQLHSKLALMESGERSIERLPDCMWIHDQRYQAAGLGERFALAAAGPRLLSDQLSKRLPEVADLPAAVVRLAEGQGPLGPVEVSEIATAIVRAGADDRQEPSLEVLGRNIEAFNLLNVFRTAYAQKVTRSGDADAYVGSVERAAEGSPLAPLLQTFRLRKANPSRVFAPIMKDFEFKDGNPDLGYDLFRSLPTNLQLANMTAHDAYKLCWYGHMHDEEFIALDRFRSRRIHPTTLNNMVHVSRHSPLRIATLLQDQFDNVKDKAAEWEQEYGRFPAVRRALGLAYEEQGDLPKAASNLAIAADTFPDFATLDRLAGVYVKLGDDRWLPTVQRVLQLNDPGLDHGRANAKIAGTLMAEGRFDDALPFAQAAARTGASWAELTLLECLTGLGDWAEAEQTARADTARYHHHTWFVWCAATGQGDLTAAWEAEQQRMRERDEFADSNLKAKDVWRLIATNQEQQAKNLVESIIAGRYRPWYGMLNAQLADALNDSNTRDQALARLAEWRPPNESSWSPYPGLAGSMQRALQEDRSLTPQDLDEIFAGRDDRKRWEGGLLFHLGEFNRLHAQGDERTAVLKEVARFASVNYWPRILAWARLRQEGVDPAQLEGRRFEMQYAGAPDIQD